MGWWESAAADCVDIATRYEGFDAGLTDASLVALAAYLGTTRIATFDERHFRSMRPQPGGQTFALFPADAA